MKSRATLFGHSVHQMLIVFPLGGELVTRLGIGVTDGAGLNASNSMHLKRAGSRTL